MADFSNSLILCFCTKLVTEVHLVSERQDLELHSHRYLSIFVQKVQILLQKLLMQFTCFFSRYRQFSLYIRHVKMQYMLTTCQRLQNVAILVDKVQSN